MIMKSITLMISCFLFAGITFAQTGINNNNPEQILDVGGKVKIADDTNAPTAGTIRYNNTTNDFEGHNGSAWNSFTQQPNIEIPEPPSGPIPRGARPVHAQAILTVGETEDLDFQFLSNPSSTFTQVPAGEFLFITSVEVYSNDLGTNGIFSVGLTPTVNGGGNGRRSNTFRGNRMSTNHFTDQYGLLVTGRSNETISVSNASISDFTVNVRVSGFVVDNLDY